MRVSRLGVVFKMRSILELHYAEWHWINGKYPLTIPRMVYRRVRDGERQRHQSISSQYHDMDWCIVLAIASACGKRLLARYRELEVFTNVL